MKNLNILIFLLFTLSFYGQNDTIFSEQESNISQVTVKRNNIIYRGIRNEIFIKVPNPETLTASTTGLTIENSRFFISPGIGNEQILFLSFKNNEGKIIFEKHIFKIKNLKHSLGIINGNNCTNCIVLLKREDLKNAKISIVIPDFKEFECGSFRISYYSKKDKKSIVLDNDVNILSNENYIKLSEMKVGERFTVFDITNKFKCDSCSEFVEVIQVEVID